MAVIYAFVFMCLTTPGFVRALRTLSWIESRVIEGKKPWACDVCMTFWSLVLVWAPVAVGVWGLEALPAIPPAYTAAFLILERVVGRAPENYPMIGPE